jgi:glycosyltransferase involved in cell wall biosynthesis
MRILTVNTRHYHGGGDSTYAFNLAELLRSHGHSVAFFAMRDPRNIPDPNEDLFVSHIDFRELNRNKGFLNGLKVVKRAIYSSEARMQFSRMLERFRPDIIHLQNIHAHITPSVIFEAKARGLPVVWTLHDYKLICPNSHYLIDATGEICEACGPTSFYPAVLKRCKKGSPLASAMAAIEAYAHHFLRIKDRVDLFLSPSAFLRDKLVEKGMQKDRVAHLPLFLPDAFFDGNSSDEGYILFMSKLDPLKGIWPLLAACSNTPEIKLFLAGNLDETLSEKIMDFLPDNTRYIGLKEGKELRLVLQEARAVVLPSLWYENQPFSILEAAAAGKPVIASDLGGMKELIRHGETGFLVPPGDISGLRNAMIWIMKNPSKAKVMGESARTYAKQNHSAQVHYEKLIEAYRAAMN